MKRKALSVLFTVLLFVTVFSVSAFAENEATAKIGDTEYATLEDAVAAVPADGTETTITLLGDAAGNGIIVKAGQNVVIDFGGFTYSIEGKLVGSAGTETLSFQLLKGADVTLRNGVVTSTKAKMLVQNYADLTLEDIVLDGTKSEVNQYTLSNNFGNTVITGATEILGDENTVAFDVWYGMFATYDEGVSVTFDKDFSGKVVGDIEYGAAGRVTADNWQEKASLSIEAGSFDGEFVATSATIEEANIEISGGRFTLPVNSVFCADGLAPCTYGAKDYGVCEIKNTAKIGDTEYATLEDAVAAVPTDGTQTTVELLSDATGNGIIVKDGQNVVIDFGGFTYFADGNQVGSTGTETLSFQLLKGATVTLKNGVISSTKTKMLVQNYADLTLEDIILDGTKSEVNQYTLSNNFGDTVITGATEILGDENTVAFDVWYGMFATYDEGVSVTFDKDFSGKVVGNIEYGAAVRVTADSWQEKAPLTIRAGTFDGEFVATSATIEEANIEISGGRFTSPLKAEFCAAGYEATSFADGMYGVCKHSVKKVFESKDKTCEENGYDKIKCVDCEYTITIEYISAGHSFTIYTSDNNATFTEDGTKTAYCNYGCGKTDTLPDNGSKRVLGKTASLTAVSKPDYVTLSWTSVPDATGYRVFIYEGGWKKVADITSCKYTVKNLDSGKLYSFAVRAYAKEGDSTFWGSSYVSLKTYTAPTPPKAVKISAKTTDSITLTWNKCTGATGYRVYLKTASGWKTLKTTTGLSYKVTGLDKNTKYTFAVKPYVKYDSNYIWASKYTSFSASTAYLDAPALRVATTAKGRLTAAWEDISGESGYQLYYSTSKSSGYKKLSNYKAGTEKVYETGFESGKTYYFKVRAYTKVDGKYVYSDYSAVKTLKIK